MDGSTSSLFFPAALVFNGSNNSTSHQQSGWAFLCAQLHAPSLGIGPRLSGLAGTLLLQPLHRNHRRFYAMFPLASICRLPLYYYSSHRERMKRQILKAFRLYSYILYNASNLKCQEHFTFHLPTSAYKTTSFRRRGF